MADNLDELINQIKSKHLSGDVKDPGKPLIQKYLGDPLKNIILFLFRRKGLGLSIIASIIVLFFLVAFLLEDYVTKRQAYPIRQVLYQGMETVSYSGRHVGPLARLRDRDSRTIIQKGNNDGTKLGDILGIFKLESSDEGRQYQLEDANKTRFAYAVEKHEPVQAGLSFRGTLDFREIYSEIIGREEKYIRYSFVPERGGREVSVQVLMAKDGGKTLINKLTTYRSWPLGVIWGPDFRAGTALDEFVTDTENAAKQSEIFQLIDQYQQQKTLSATKRSELLDKILAVIDSMATINIYMSYEDGIVDYVPQESSTYLFLRPDFSSRLSAAFSTAQLPAAPLPKGFDVSRNFQIDNQDKQVLRIRVENQMDFWPGNYWPLNQMEMGEAPNIVRPFAHTNNGGYTIEDQKGVIAQIVIQDFFLHYGDDLLYRYYLDKNGDGKIDFEKENIGQVLYRIHHDQRPAAVEGPGQSTTQKDVTKRFSYSFMAGFDWDNRIDDFYLCNTIESFIVNEINRGFSKHSDIGWINIQRSNIRLLENRSIENLARALSPESALVAKQDIVALLQAAHREYIGNFIKTENSQTPN